MLSESDATKYIETYQSLSPNCIALHVADNSMEPLFYEDEVIIICPLAHGVYPQDKSFVVAKIDKDQFVLRRYLVRRNNAFDLQAENEQFATLSSVAGGSVPEIVGVVVEHRKTHFL